jgi:rhamnose transport system ATP-binding protein
VPELLDVRSVSKSFAGVAALRGVSFDLAAGEVHALVGENGAGKSTLIKVVTGAHQPDEGTLEVLGRPVEHNSPLASRALGIAAIYQQPALFPDLTVAENVAIGLERGGAWRRIDWAARRARAEALLARIGARTSPEALVSGLGMSEQQLVEIARALGAEARVLIMDEPTASLSEHEAAHLFKVIRELTEEGVGIVYVSHRMEEIFGLAQRVTVLRDGAKVDTRAITEVDRSGLVRLMVGREMSAIFPKRAVARGGVALSVRGLGCRASGIAGVSFDLHAGEILGLAGLVGSGRTELARALFGLTPADEGEIRLKGQRVTIDSPAAAVALGLAYVPEDRPRHGVILALSVAANASLAVLRQLASLGFLDFVRERALASRYVDALGIKTASLEAPAATLSGGNQQKVALARWLATEPVVLILDEPTQGIDVGAKAEVHRLMGDLAERGLAILMISSELPEVLGMSDRIGVMRGGRLAEVLDRADATPEGILAVALGHGRSEAAVAPTAAAAPASASAPAAAAPTPAPPAGKTAVGARARRHTREWSLALAYGAILAVLAATAPSFFGAANLVDVAVSAAPLLIAAIGMTLVILSRHIDISIGSQFAVCGVAAGLLAKEDLPMALVALGTVAVGALLGSLNGALVAGLELPSIVVTLATMVTWREGLRWATEGVWVQDLPAGFQWFGLGQTAGRALIVGIALVAFALFAWGLRSLAAGRNVYAVGSEMEAARLAGIRPGRVVFGVFVLMGALTGLAALLTSIQFIDVQTNAGVGFELRVIAAVVVGGVAITGGRGTLAGPLLGVAFLATIGPALVFLGGKAHWDKAVQGAIILAAVATDALAARRRGETRG